MQALYIPSKDKMCPLELATGFQIEPGEGGRKGRRMRQEDESDFLSFSVWTTDW